MSRLFLIFAFLACTGTMSGQTATTLSPQQIEALKAVKMKTEQQAAPYARKMAATIKAIYDNMLSAHEDQRLRRKLAAELHRNAGKLLDLKGQSFRDSLAVLTPEQRQTIREALKKPDAPSDIGELIEKTFGLRP
jgi:Spy/CpxP family protein refolding chaperone